MTLITGHAVLRTVRDGGQRTPPRKRDVGEPIFSSVSLLDGGENWGNRGSLTVRKGPRATLGLTVSSYPLPSARLDHEFRGSRSTNRIDIERRGLIDFINPVGEQQMC